MDRLSTLLTAVYNGAMHWSIYGSVVDTSSCIWCRLPLAGVLIMSQDCAAHWSWVKYLIYRNYFIGFWTECCLTVGFISQAFGFVSVL